MPINPKLVHAYRLTEPIEARPGGAWVLQYHGESFLTDPGGGNPEPFAWSDPPHEILHFEVRTREEIAGQLRINPAKLGAQNSLVLGNPYGKKKLFVFTDPECPFCGKLHAELKKLTATEPQLAVYIKLYPLKMHPKAYDKARVILGAKSLALLERSFAGGALPAPGPKDSRKPVDATIRFAEANGIHSTPTLVLSDGRVVTGFRDAASIKALLATAR